MMFSLKKVLARHKGRIFEKWIFHAKSPLLSSASIADIDDDGKQEIVFGSKDGTIYCVDQESNILWSYKSSLGISKEDAFFYDSEKISAIYSSPVLFDINHDGKKEIIFGSESGLLIVLDNEGKLIWEKKLDGPIRSTPKIVDFNNNGSFEILVGANKLFVLSDKGDVIAEYDVGSPIEATPAVIRGVNGGNSKVIFSAIDGVVRAFDSQEQKLWEYATEGKITAEPIIFDDKVLITSWDGRLYVLDHGGEELWRYKTGGSIYQKAIISDVNDDGKKEILISSCDNSVYVLTLDGERLWSYETGFWVVASPLPVDFDNDGRIEVIVGSYDTNLYVLDGEGSYEIDYVPGLSGVTHQPGHYADVLSSEPGVHRGKKLWQRKLQGMVVGCSLLEDNSIIVNLSSGIVDSIGHKD